VAEGKIDQFLVNVQAQLSAPGELRNVEFKRPFSWSERPMQIKVIRTLIGMANIQDGGRIIIGIDDATHSLIGLGSDQLASFDTTKINEQLAKYSDPKIDCELRKVILDGEHIIVIDVAEFLEIPIICKEDTSAPSSKEILRRGALYYRNAKCESTEIGTVEDMRDLLKRATSKTGEVLVRQIDDLLSRYSNISNRKITDQDNLAAAKTVASKLLSKIGELVIK
jgi:predicted HTH transcriptional regulator